MKKKKFKDGHCSESQFILMSEFFLKNGLDGTKYESYFRFWSVKSGDWSKRETICKPERNSRVEGYVSVRSQTSRRHTGPLFSLRISLGKCLQDFRFGKCRCFTKLNEPLRRLILIVLFSVVIFHYFIVVSYTFKG